MSHQTICSVLVLELLACSCAMEDDVSISQSRAEFSLETSLVIEKEDGLEEPSSAWKCARSEPMSDAGTPGQLNCLREPPLRSLRVTHVVHVADFGAVPDDDGDDLLALRRATEAALAMGPATKLLFDRGRYLLEPQQDRVPALLIRGAKNLLLDGNGAEIVIRNPTTGFLRIDRSENVIVRDFSVDFDPLPFTQTVVEEVDVRLGSVVVEVQADFPLLDEAHFRTSKRWVWPFLGVVSKGLLKDPEHAGRLKSGVPNTMGVTKIEALQGRRYRLDVGVRQAAFFQEGDHYVHLARGGPAVFEAKTSRQVSFQRLTIYTSPGPAYLSGGSSLVNLLDDQVRLKDGRWQSTDADGIIAYRNRIGPWIENCLFEGNGDDSININTPGGVGLKRLDARTFVVGGRVNHLGNRPPFEVQAGDRLRIFEPNAGQLLGDSIVEQVLPGPEVRTWEVRFEKALQQVAVGETSDAPVFYNDDTAGAGFVVRGNKFHNTRRYGVVVQSHHGLIEGNYFLGTSGNAISVINTIHSGSGFAARHVQILHNRFEDCYHQMIHRRGKPHAAIVATGLEGNGYRPAVWRGIEDVRVEGNTFVNWSQVPALKLANGNRMTVRDNYFIHRVKDGAGQPPPAIDVVNSQHVIRENNRVEDVRLSP